MKISTQKGTSIVLVLLLFIINSCQNTKDTHRIEVEINPNIELLGLAYFIVFESDGLKTDSIHFSDTTLLKKDWHNYGYYLVKKYKAYASSENLSKSLTVADHLWLDYLYTLLLQVEPFPNARLNDEIDSTLYLHFSLQGDLSEARNNASLFLEGLNAFYREIQFDDYLTDSHLFYEKAIQEVKDGLPANEFIEANELFYKKSFNRYVLIPSLTTPKGMGFGLRNFHDQVKDIFNVFGALDYQSFSDPDALQMGFSNKDRLHELSAHEFGHSFVNPVIDEIPEDLIQQTEHLFDSLQSVMSDQGYTTWKACLSEHFVRAGEIYLWTKLNQPETAEKLRTEYINTRKFIYTPTIIKELENYEKGIHASYSEAVIKSIERFK